MEEYIYSTVKIMFHCNICGNEWMTTPSRIISGNGCPNCAIISNRISKEEILNRIYKNGSNKHLELLGDVSTLLSKVKVICLDCKNEWETTPRVIIKATNLNKDKKYCPFCNQKNKKSHEDFLKEMSDVNKSIKIVGKYQSRNKKVECFCKECKFTWRASATHLLNKHGCPNCATKLRNEKLTVTTIESLTKDFLELENNILPIGNYDVKTRKVDCKCLKCNTMWRGNVSNIKSGHGCPECNKNKSRLEDSTEKYLIENDIEYIKQYRFYDCRNVLPLPFDFYLKDLNICIECDGLQHEKPVDIFGGKEQFEIQKRNDSIKDKYCTENNIKLIRIKHSELLLIKDIIKNIKEGG